MVFCKMARIESYSNIDHIIAVLQIAFLCSASVCPKELVQKCVADLETLQNLQLTFLLLGIVVDGFQQTEATILDGLMAKSIVLTSVIWSLSF